MLEWWLWLLILVGFVLLLMTIAVPVAFVFLLIGFVGALIFWGGEQGLNLFILNLRKSVATFILIPVPMYVLLGEVMSKSGMAFRMADVLDKWLGRLPGRLSLLAVAWSTLFSTMSGSSIATTAMMGATLLPEMEKRGYKKPMSIGPIIGSGGLAMIIPPSSFAVLIGAIGGISIAKLLIAGIIPGLLLATTYAVYIIIRCWLQPSLAPSYDVTPTPLADKMRDTVKYVLPLGFIVFVVIGFILLGLSTPTEAAAIGTVACFFLAACYRRLNWEIVKKSVMSTVEVTGMILLIIAGAQTFSQILGMSGGTSGLTRVVESLTLSPVMTVIAIQLVLLILGCFMSYTGMLMIVLPIAMPLIFKFGLDPVWFGLLTLINVEMAQLTPPYGILLFVMQGVAPKGTTMGDIIKAMLPFFSCNTLVLVLCLAFPILALWLPGLMR